MFQFAWSKDVSHHHHHHHHPRIHLIPLAFINEWYIKPRIHYWIHGNYTESLGKHIICIAKQSKKLRGSLSAIFERASASIFISIIRYQLLYNYIYLHVSIESNNCPNNEAISMFSSDWSKTFNIHVESCNEMLNPLFG